MIARGVIPRITDRRGVRMRRIVALALLGVIVMAVMGAPWLARYGPRETAPDDQFQRPSADHLFGTDLLGRDVYSRVLYGGRHTLSLALLTAAITLLPGLGIGLVAGSAGGWIDRGLMAFMDALLAIPSLVTALALVALVGSGSAEIALAVGIAGVPAYARVTRAAVLAVRARPFIDSARAIGTRYPGLLQRYILPNAAAPLVAFAGVTLSWAILNSAALTFLGYGGDITSPDWGVMLADGRQAFRTAPWAAFAPGAALSLTVFAIHLLAGSFRAQPG
ncbi:MAG: ABC transporter permease [Anaerolineae bacterium]|nr:ABC transporter permease [Anaerolineae bacterium]